MSVPFVGRRDELRQLGDLLALARREHVPIAALIAGEPGSGKSRLLREVVAGVDPRRTVLVTGYEPTQPIALAAVGALIRRLATVPDHGPRLGGLAFGTTELQGQGLLAVFEAAHRAHAAFGPLLLAIDDLQWVDAQSLSLIHYLVSAAEASTLPLAVLAAARPSAAADSFVSGIGGPLPEDRRVLVGLRGLAIEDGTTLAQAIDPGLDDHRAEELWRRAAGSPFWLEALARAREDIEAGDPIAYRLRALSADAGATLHMLVVGARPFPLEELRVIAGWPEDRLNAAVRELVGRGLAVEGPGSVRLAHDLIREAAGRGIQAAAGRALHVRLAEALERLAGGDIQLLAEALDHRVAARLPAVELAARLVASPQRRLLGPQQLLRLSSIADDLPAGTAEQLELDRGLGRLASELGEQGLALRHWNRVALAAPDPLLRQKAHIEAARAAIDAGNAGDAHAHVDQARSVARDPIALVELDALEARIGLELDNDLAAATPLAERAVMGGRELGVASGGVAGMPAEARSALLAAVLVAANAAWAGERTDDLVPLIEESLEIADGLGDEARIQALPAAAWAYGQIGLLVQAEALSRAAFEASDRLLLPLPKFEAVHGLVRQLFGLGRLEEARTMAREMAAVEARIHPRPFGDLAGMLLAVIELALDAPGALDRLEAAALKVDPHISIMWRATVATWIARRDGHRSAAEVERQLAAGRTASDNVKCPRCDGELQVMSVGALARVGRLAEARHALVGWEAGLRGQGHVARSLWQAQAHASMAIASGSPDAAAQLISLATAYEAGDRILDAAWSRLDLGRVLSRSGDRTAAIAALSAAAALARRSGAVGVERLAAQALRELGVRAWRRGPAAAGAEASATLSGREREIADLVAGGATNQEVATTLAISPKTVERHLTNILAKLDVRNRTELAALVRDPRGTGFSR